MKIEKNLYEEVIALEKAKAHENLVSSKNVSDDSLIKIIALQHELDDEQLTEWREKRAGINLKEKLAS